MYTPLHVPVSNIYPRYYPAHVPTLADMLMRWRNSFLQHITFAEKGKTNSMWKFLEIAPKCRDFDHNMHSEVEKVKPPTKFARSLRKILPDEHYVDHHHPFSGEQTKSLFKSMDNDQGHAAASRRNRTGRSGAAARSRHAKRGYSRRGTAHHASSASPRRHPPSFRDG